jgi:hypothetical protein
MCTGATSEFNKASFQKEPVFLVFHAKLPNTTDTPPLSLIIRDVFTNIKGAYVTVLNM